MVGGCSFLDGPGSIARSTPDSRGQPVPRAEPEDVCAGKKYQSRGGLFLLPGGFESAGGDGGQGGFPLALSLGPHVDQSTERTRIYLRERTDSECEAGTVPRPLSRFRAGGSDRPKPAGDD